MAASAPLAPAGPLVMGVINLTPDSFSDGGAWTNSDIAVSRALELWEQGADIVELGAESTRPGSAAVDGGEEWRRLEPVLAKLARSPCRAQLGIDTRNPDIMLRSMDYGVGFINNVDGLVPEPILQRLACNQIQYLAMHMHGCPMTMQNQPLEPREALAAVDNFFARADATLRIAGFASANIWLDPGIGFGKNDLANFHLLGQISKWTAQGYQIAVGISRKGFLGRALEIPQPSDRDAASKMLELGLAWQGAKLLRTHDVRRLKRVLATAFAEPATT